MRLYIAVDINDPNDDLADDHAAHLADAIVSAKLLRSLDKDADGHANWKMFDVTVVAAGRLIAEVDT